MRREWGQGFFIYYLTIYNLLFSPLADFFYSHADLTKRVRRPKGPKAISRNGAASNSFGEINLPSSQPTLSYRVGSQPVGLQPSVCSRTVARAKRLASVRFVRSV